MFGRAPRGLRGGCFDELVLVNGAACKALIEFSDSIISVIDFDVTALSARRAD